MSFLKMTSDKGMNSYIRLEQINYCCEADKPDDDGDQYYIYLVGDDTPVTVTESEFRLIEKWLEPQIIPVEKIGFESYKTGNWKQDFN